MKANELMIGDWVMVTECVADAHFIDYPDKIESIRDGLVGLESDGLETIIERIAPIPLTADTLERNGFKCKEIIQSHWISEDGRILLRNDESLISSNNKWSVHVDNEDMQTIGYFEITYVHEL